VWDVRDWDLSVLMVIKGGMGLLEAMEWSGRRFLGGGGAVLLSSNLLLTSSHEMRILRSELLKPVA
jgi:hypothetical protein